MKGPSGRSLAGRAAPRAGPVPLLRERGVFPAGRLGPGCSGCLPWDPAACAVSGRTCSLLRFRNALGCLFLRCVSSETRSHSAHPEGRVPSTEPKTSLLAGPGRPAAQELVGWEDGAGAGSKGGGPRSSPRGGAPSALRVCRRRQHLEAEGCGLRGPKTSLPLI